MDDDEKAAQETMLAHLMAHDALRNTLEAAFYCHLDDTGALFETPPHTSVKALRLFCVQCGMVADPEVDDRQAEIDSGYLMTAVEVTMSHPVIGRCLSDPLIDFPKFVSVVANLGFSRFKIQKTQPVLVVDTLCADYIAPWVDACRQRHEATGLEPLHKTNVLTQQVDRLVYAHLSPLSDIYQRQLQAGGAGPPQNAALQGRRRLATAAVLSGVVRDYSISRATTSEVALLLEAVRTGPARNTAHRPPASAAAAAQPDQDDSAAAASCLYTFVGFVEFLVRLAQVVYTKSSTDVKEWPSVSARFVALLRHMEAPYKLFFEKTIPSQCNWEPQGVPVLSRNALAPSVCDGTGGHRFTIDGAGFCTERAVFVRFTPADGDGPPLVLEAEEVAAKRVRVVTPVVETTQVVVSAHCGAGTQSWAVDIARRAVYHVECSNDGFDFSSTVPLQVFSFQQRCPTWAVPQRVSAELHRAFVMVVSYRDRRNTRFMTLERWKRFKAAYDVCEGWEGRPGGGGGLSPGSAGGGGGPGTDSRALAVRASSVSAAGAAAAAHPFFFELCQEQVLPPLLSKDGDAGPPGMRSALCVDFKAFLRLLCKCACLRRDVDATAAATDPSPADGGGGGGGGGGRTLAFHPELPAATLGALAERVVQQEEGRVEIAVDDILKEIAATREAIALIEHKAQRVLDVYLGPVLCATVTDRPGHVSIARAAGGGAGGNDGVLQKQHRLLTCVVYDRNNEREILEHVGMSDTFSHLLHRLLRQGFDLAAPMDPQTRQPAGRCWHVLDNEEKVGVLWDYPGHFSNHHWQPTALDAHSAHVTMTVYRHHEDLAYIVPFLQFLKADSAARMRKLLTQRGYTLRTCLYKKV